jgi:hypothetical protein
LKNINENSVSEQVSRGEKRVQETESFENVLSKNSENFETKTASEPLYTAGNSELDGLLSEATTTKTEQAINAKAEQVQQAKPENQMISSKQATEIAAQGLQEFCNGVAESTGRQLTFGSTFVKLFSCALSPVIQKYSRHINVDPDNVDLDSWQPELLALGSITALGGSTFLQCRKPIELKADNKGAESGDKSEPSA